MSDDDDFASFKNCMQIQLNLDLEAWDVALWEPMKALVAWWKQQQDFTKLFSGFLLGKGAKVLSAWIAGVAGITEAALALSFAQALIAVAAGIALGTFLDVAGRCIAQLPVS